MNDEAKAPEYLIVGQVVAPFGVQGELKVNILTEFPDRFKTLEQVTLAPFSYIAPELVPAASLNPATARSFTHRAPNALRPPAEPTPFAIEATHIHKGQLRLKLEGVSSPEDGEALRGYWVLVPLGNARQLPQGAYYIYQIVGLEVYTTAGDFIGKVEDVITATANDVYVVRGPGVRDPGGELLVPAIKMVVKRVDPNEGRVTIAPLEEWT
jgi:16S rRNA processing protein RimM